MPFYKVLQRKKDGTLVSPVSAWKTTYKLNDWTIANGCYAFSFMIKQPSKFEGHFTEAWVSLRRKLALELWEVDIGIVTTNRFAFTNPDLAYYKTDKMFLKRQVTPFYREDDVNNVKEV